MLPGRPVERWRPSLVSADPTMTTTRPTKAQKLRGIRLLTREARLRRELQEQAAELQQLQHRVAELEGRA